MEQSKNRIQKFVTLLKQAQNAAFVSLVSENINLELISKPQKLVKILNFLAYELASSSSDFTRVKVSEGLAPILNKVISQVGPQQFITSLEEKLNQESEHKRTQFQKKLETSILCIDLENLEQDQQKLQQKLGVITIKDIIQNKNFFNDLINNYQPLLAREDCREEGKAMPGGTNEDLKKVFIDSALGMNTEKAGLKLSDFIDEEFFDDLDMDFEFNSEPNNQKQPLTTLFNSLSEKSQSQTIPLPNVQKRTKTSENSSITHKYLILSPTLALLLYFQDLFLSTTWQDRQVAGAFLNSLLKQKNIQLDYFILGLDSSSNKFTCQQSIKLKPDGVLKTLLSKLFIFLIMDRFNDYEELKVLTPSREEGLQLLKTLQSYQILDSDFQLLVQVLPVVLRSVEQDNWIGRFNFFLILKHLMPKWSVFVFKAFHRVLIESLIKVEEEVKILVNEIIEQLLENYQQRDDYIEVMGILLKNLQENLKESDDIDVYSISVFSLIQKILETTKNLDQLKFQTSLEIFCPFNFHRIVNVRYSYNKILNKCLTSFQFNQDELDTLTQLTLQSLTMERSKIFSKILLSNLQSLTKQYDQKGFMNFLSMIMQLGKLQDWLYKQRINDFSHFIFIESDKFDSINGDYYKVVYRPVLQREFEQFFYDKMKCLTKSYSVLMLQSQESAQYILKIQENNINYLLKNENLNLDAEENMVITEYHLPFLLMIHYYIKEPNQIDLDVEYLNKITEKFLSFDFKEFTSVFLYPDFEIVQPKLLILKKLFQKYNLELTQLNNLLTCYDICVQNEKLCNINALQNSLQNLIVFIHQQNQDKQDLNDCFQEITSVFSQIITNSTTIINRVKCLSAVIQIQLIKQGRTNMNWTNINAILNNLVRPLIFGAQEETVPFLQKIISNHLIQLTLSLMRVNKVKATQQILGQIWKILEVLGEDNPVFEPSSLKSILHYLIKHNPNIFTAYNNYFLDQIKKEINQDNYKQWTNVTLFILQEVFSDKNFDKKTYQDQGPILQKQVSHSLLLNIDYQAIPDLVQQIFNMFPSQRVELLSTLVYQMDKKSKVAFDSLSKLLEGQNPDIMNFIPIFIIPVIKSMQYSRQIFNNDKSVTLLLASLLQLLPLNLSMISDIAIGKNQGLAQDLQVLAQEGYNFLQVFVNNSMIEEYKLSIKVNATLRDYQKQGITWISSLGKYNLNCALCDDMGLGKTIQSLCVVLNESFLIHQKTNQKPINLIVCPTSLTYNWQNEVKKFFPDFKAIVYEGTSVQKNDILKNKANCDIIIASYEKVRGELKGFLSLNCLYVVLDEAHIIKNSKAKVTQAVKSLQCEKKIILTGTPLQNKVSELWSIFDFLAPGFLEEESVFNKKYNQYLTANLKKLSEKLEETQIFVDALKSLKKRISPFILRRTKQDVLKELPPKIIQDYPCKMTKFQEFVHGLIEKLHPISQTLKQTEEGKDKKQGKQILQNLLLHRRVCNHPCFVLEQLKEEKSLKKAIENKNIKEIEHYDQSGKMQGLVDLLIECDIIEAKTLEGKEEKKQSVQHTQDDSLMAEMVFQAENSSTRVFQKHKVLLFCQMSAFLNKIKTDVLEKYKIVYTQILSAHSPKERLEICEQFNNDEDIQVLLLTTQVGGLGLNLTGADTIIFAEHDWNPMKDLQAIDRAHRIGQTRTLNVYRLIVCDSLEEKIMSLQRFKENLARNLVQARGIGQEDANQLEMTELLKSFEEHSSYLNGQKQENKFEDKMISNLEEIWQAGNLDEL